MEMDSSVVADPAEFADTVMDVIADDSLNGQWVRMKSAKAR
jgi:hypothetical protein